LRSSARLSFGRSLGAQCGGGISHQPRTERSHAAHEALRSGNLPRVGSYSADDVVWEAPDTLPTGGVIRVRDAVIER